MPTEATDSADARHLARRRDLCLDEGGGPNRPQPEASFETGAMHTIDGAFGA